MNIKKTVRQVLHSKGSDFWWISPGSTAYQALEIMAEKDIGALMVLDGQRLVGIFSERDYARKVILKGKSSKETSVAELMSAPVICVGPDHTLELCMALMGRHHVRHLPVVEAGRIVGLVSIGDVVNSIINEQEALIRELENYISGCDYVPEPAVQQ